MLNRVAFYSCATGSGARVFVCTHYIFMNVYHDNTVKDSKPSEWCGLGQSLVVMWGQSLVVMWGQSLVVMWGQSLVVMWGQSLVVMWGQSRVMHRC